ncbi:MAG: leucine-rich repeat domain-containing protein [Treponema socranskii subsp. buccale]
MEELECDANQLTELKVQGLRALQTLRCYDNRLTSLDVHGLGALKELECYGNLLTALNAQGCTALEKLHCRKNQLTVLNVQGCTALRGVDCLSNKLDAQAFTKLFSDLPAWTGYAYCYLYTEEKGVSEGNCKDFTNFPDLKTAFEKAKDEKKWTMYKIDTDKSMVEI